MRHRLLAALMIMAAFAHAGTVTMNFAARVGDVNNTIRANDTSYGLTHQYLVFSDLQKRYISANKTNTIAALVSAGEFSSAYINMSYYKSTANSSTILMLHLDNTTLDSSQYGNNGTLQGADCSATTPGRTGTSCKFDGASSYINLTRLNDLEGQGNYTAAAWISTTSSAARALFTQSDPAGSHIISLFFNGGPISFLTYEGGSANVDDNLAVNDGAWHHVAITKNGTTGSVYVDGLLRKTGTVASVTGTTEIRIGRYYGASNAFDGYIDEVTVYNKSLAAYEIYDLYAFDPRFALLGIRQKGDANRFLIAVTNGTYGDIERRLQMVSDTGIVSTTFGNFPVYVPSSYPLFIRLEYSDIDIRGDLRWSGIGQLIIKNTGNSNGRPEITVDVVR